MSSSQLPAAEFAPAKFRFRMRTLLLVTTVVAVFFAIAAPYFREMTANAWKNVATMWISTLFFASIGAWLLPSKTRRFYARQPRDYLVRIAVKDPRWLAIGVTVAMLLVISVVLYNLGSFDKAWNWMIVFSGLLNGIMVSSMFRNTRTYFALNDDGVSCIYGCTPWENVHGVVQDDAENVIGLKLLAGDLKFFVPPDQRGEILAYLEEKTGHKLGE